MFPKKIVLGWMVLLSLTFFLQTATGAELTVYASDSFTSKGSLGELLKQKFEKINGIKVTYVSFPSTGEALNQIAIEQKQTHADLLVGVDNSLIARAKQLGAFLPLEIKGVKNIRPELLFDRELHFVPYDYGYLTFVFDKTRTQLPSTVSLQKLALDPAFRSKIVIEDPRTSSIGLGFLVFAHEVFDKAGYVQFWKNLSRQLLSVAPSWSSAYGLFLKKEAELVLSYTTSPAYHIEKENKHDIQAVVFSEGNYRQIEGAGIVKYTKKPELAKKWIEFLLSKNIQDEVATHNWMYPILENANVPASFAKLPKVTKVVQPDPIKIESSKKSWLREWASLMGKP
ncbi:MAG: thiamine ABC transporter substrate-binding protein [Deltaproteobacteria bacterium]|nr:thiamine ABC transporter substrate-binding protein [Deltaproteobacteria bacterium]